MTSLNRTLIGLNGEGTAILNLRTFFVLMFNNHMTEKSISSTLSDIVLVL